MAYSNDSFELWFLMFIQNIDIDLFSGLNRNDYYTLLDKSSKLKNIYQKLNFKNYKDGGKEAKFIDLFLKEFGKIEQFEEAIKKAKNLDETFEYLDKQKQYAKKIPCTLVYKLIEGMIKK